MNSFNEFLEGYISTLQKELALDLDLSWPKFKYKPAWEKPDRPWAARISWDVLPDALTDLWNEAYQEGYEDGRNESDYIL